MWGIHKAMLALMLLVNPAPSEAPLATTPKYFVHLDLIVPLTCGNALGTGTIINNQQILTAAHVVDAYPGTTCKLGTIDLKVVYKDAKLDMAVLEVPAPIFGVRAPIACEPVKEGELYFTFGYNSGNFIFEPLIGDGQYRDIRVYDPSTKKVTVKPHMSTFRGKIHSGMSGGPIFNRWGNIVAIGLTSSQDFSNSSGRELLETYLCKK